MRKGIRVVRGPDWNYDNHDGGEGGVGTVVEVPGDPGFTLPGKFVMVRWDVGEKHLYRIGEGDAYDLFIFNNATAGVSHILPCDGCSDNLVEGLRWKCTRCGDYNLCSTCYMSDKHDLTHEFLRFDSRRSEGFPIPSRSSSQDQRVKSRGIFTGAKVCRGANWMWDNQF
ncbi:E3 ubiquitin-protein ligase MIB2, partial [Biomphalaria glabrata]